MENKNKYRSRLLKCAEKAKKAGFNVDIQEDSKSMFIFLFRDGLLCENIYMPYDRYEPSAEKEISHFENFTDAQYKRIL